MTNYAEVSVEFYNQIRENCDKYEDTLNKMILETQEELRTMATNPETDILEYNKKVIDCSKLMTLTKLMNNVIGDFKRNVTDSFISLDTPYTINQDITDILKDIPVEEDGCELNMPAGFVELGNLGVDFVSTENQVCGKIRKEK